MNAEPIPGEEERKGCSGHIGKMIFSAGVEQLAVTAYVPEEKQGDLECKEWLQTVLNLFGGQVVTEGKSVCQGVVKADGDKGIFPLKIREAMILEANNFLRKKRLFPEDKDDSDDDFVFGDDDFPSAERETAEEVEPPREEVEPEEVPIAAACFAVAPPADEPEESPAPAATEESEVQTDKAEVSEKAAVASPTKKGKHAKRRQDKKTQKEVVTAVENGGSADKSGSQLSSTMILVLCSVAVAATSLLMATWKSSSKSD